MGLFQQERKTLAELQEENDEKEIELSIAQKEAMLLKLRNSGLSVKNDFGGSIRSAWNWFKKH